MKKGDTWADRFRRMRAARNNAASVKVAMEWKGSGAPNGDSSSALPPITEPGEETMPRQNTVKTRTAALDSSDRTGATK